MTASGGMMPPTIARYNARRQRVARHSLEDAVDISEAEGGEVLPTILRLVGEDATVLLLEEYGGTRMFVPAVAGAETKLSKLIGRPAAELISAEFGGRYVRVPVGRAFRGAAYRKRGWTYPKIAKALCMTDNAVARLLRSSDAALGNPA